MHPIHEHIRTNVRTNSDAIRALKDKALTESTYINPKHQNWDEYQGRKREVTKWLIMLHQFKEQPEKIKNHHYSKERGQPLHKTIIHEALQRLKEITEQYEKGQLLNQIAETQAKIAPSPVRYQPSYRVTAPEI